jgi:putative transposase
MRKSKFTETQIVSILKQADAGVPVKDVCRQAGISVATYYQWKSKLGGMEASELKRVRELEEENSQLKRLYAGLALENSAMKDLIAKSCSAGAEARGGAFPFGSPSSAAASVLRLHRAVALGLVRPAAGLDGARCRTDRGAFRGRL